MKKLVFILLAFSFIMCQSDPLARVPQNYRPAVKQALQKAGDNQHALHEFLKACHDQEIEGAAFLLAYMPERDLKNLSPEFLIENIKYAYQAMKEVAWGKTIPDSIFLNYVLPYANLHEQRDNWRKTFYEKFLPLIKHFNTPGEAVVELNNKIWDMINVHYSTKRPKADQSPFESMEAGMASCTGLSILLIDACRAVGIPARFISVPMWYDNSGNHSWVEIWDNGWHFIGAGEPGPLDETWFEERASHANKSDWKYRIYAVSYKKTGLKFPDLFDPTVDYLYAVDVTDRYASKPAKTQDVELRVNVISAKSGERLALPVQLLQGKQKLAEGRSRGERNDMNDHLTFKVQPNQKYLLLIKTKKGDFKQQVQTSEQKIQLVTIEVEQ